jgi:hypothetical protein
MTFINNYTPHNKFEQIELQLNEIRTFLNNIDNVTKIKVGTLNISKQIENILERLNKLEVINTVGSSSSSSSNNTENANYLLAIEDLYERIQSIISTMNDIIDTVNDLSDNANTETIFNYYKEDETNEGVKVIASNDETTLVQIDKKQDTIQLGYEDFSNDNASNVNINGNITLNFNNVNLNQTTPDNHGEFQKQFNIGISGINFKHIQNNEENESKNIYIESGLRFKAILIDEKPALVISQPGRSSTTINDQTGISPYDIVLYFSTNYKVEGAEAFNVPASPEPQQPQQPPQEPPTYDDFFEE